MFLTLARFCKIERVLVVFCAAIPLLFLSGSFTLTHIEQELQSAAKLTTTDGFPVGWIRLTPTSDAQALPITTPEPQAFVSLSTDSIAADGLEISTEVSQYWSVGDGVLASLFDDRTVVEGRHPIERNEIEITPNLASLLNVVVGQNVRLDGSSYMVSGIFVVPATADALSARAVVVGDPPSDAAMLFESRSAGDLQVVTEDLGYVVEKSVVGRQSTIDSGTLVGLPGSRTLQVFVGVGIVFAVLVALSFLAIRLADHVAPLRAAGWIDGRAARSGAVLGVAFALVVATVAVVIAVGLSAATRSTIQSMANQQWGEPIVPWDSATGLFIVLLASSALGFSTLWRAACLQAYRQETGKTAGFRVAFVFQIAVAGLSAFVIVSAVQAGLIVPILLLLASGVFVGVCIRMFVGIGSRQSLRARVVSGMISFQSWAMLSLTALTGSICVVIILGASVIETIDRSTNTSLLPARTFVAYGGSQQIDAVADRLQSTTDAEGVPWARWTVVQAAAGNPARVVDAESGSCLGDAGGGAFEVCAMGGELSAVLEIGVVSDTDFLLIGSRLGINREALEGANSLATFDVGDQPSVVEFESDYSSVSLATPLNGSLPAPGLGGALPGVLIRESRLGDYGLVDSGGRAGFVAFELNDRQSTSAVMGAAARSQGLASQYEPDSMPPAVQTVERITRFFLPAVLVSLFVLASSLSRKAHVKTLGQLMRAGMTSRVATAYSFIGYALTATTISLATLAFPFTIVWWASSQRDVVAREIWSIVVLVAGAMTVAVVLSAYQCGQSLLHQARNSA